MKKIGSAFLALAIVAVMAAPLAAADMVAVEKQAVMGEAMEGKALVYFVRPAMSGKAVKFWAFSDDTLLGATKGKTFVWGHVEPGTHVFWSKGENISALEMEVAAGETYYLKQGVRMGGLKARVKLEELAEAEVEKALGKCKYATLTEEGVQRGGEIASEGLAKAREKAANREE